MKNFLTYSVAVVLLIAFAGCSSSEDEIVTSAFAEPQFLFGATRSEVIAKMGDNYSSSTSDRLTYTQPSDNVATYIYSFSDEKVIGVAMVVDDVYLSSLMNFLLERYKPLPPIVVGDDVNRYVDDLDAGKATMMITEQKYSDSSSVVLYSPFTD
ncbi:MAG: hypothetical protein LRY33_05280 [Parabacteroides chartae]|nr:hypothetical protein [Parabacteroides chartae]